MGALDINITNRTAGRSYVKRSSVVTLTITEKQTPPLQNGSYYNYISEWPRLVEKHCHATNAMSIIQVVC